MKQLSDFNTLAEAQAYTDTKHKLLPPATMNSLLARYGLYSALESIRQTPGHVFQDAVGAFLDPKNGEYNFMQTGATGPAQIALVDQILSASVIVTLGQRTVDVSAQLALLKPELIEACNVVTQPYANATQAEFDYAQTEVLAVPQNNAKHLLTLSIANSAKSPVRVEIQQRFGPDANDLTEWHTVSHFAPQVHYKQRHYEGIVPPAPAAYRELRIVSPVTLGLSIA